jgi:hypothetical protein
VSSGDPVPRSAEASTLAVNDRRLLRSLGEVLAASPLFLSAPLYRRRHLRWGASEAEVAAAMPGDEIVSDPSFNATRAITIETSPDEVWPWIVQIGYGRAGWYSYDLFDNGARPSAARILPEYQEPKVGDWVPMAAKVNEATAFKIKAFEPNAWMLWEKPDSTWAWKLTPLDDGRTRLVARLKAVYDWRKPGSALLTLILLELADFPMMRKQLRGVKRRAEAEAARRHGTVRVGRAGA